MLPWKCPLYDVLLEETVEVEELVAAINNLLTLPLQHREVEPADRRQKDWHKRTADTTVDIAANLDDWVIAVGVSVCYYYQNA